jgi:hypothetical protein
MFTWLDHMLRGWKNIPSPKNSRKGLDFHRRLQLEHLGERILPSVSLPLHPLPSLGPGPVQIQDQDHALAGRGHGTYASDSRVPDVGITYNLQGVAKLADLGVVTLTGYVHSVGFILKGHASGTLIFTNVQGSVTIALTGPVQSGFAALPRNFAYTVTGGTGAYANVEDSGTLVLILRPTAPGPRVLGPGSFTISLDQPRAVSGIDGQALVGPTYPVSRPGVPNTRPLPGAVISVETADGSTEVARTTADQNGDFQIRLAPGRYLLVPRPPKPGEYFPRGTPQLVVVVTGEYAHVTVTYDSGIV